MKNLSNWRSVRLQEHRFERVLRARYTLWLHGGCIGALVVGVMWLAATLQMRLGSDSLALRYLVTLGLGYLSYLAVLRWWAAMLVRDKPASLDVGFDLPCFGGGSSPRADIPSFQSGQGGDFGGGGASGEFDLAGEGIGKAADAALEVAGGADEGAVVVIPVVALFLMGAALLFGAGSLVLLYFGSEALLAVAVELAFGYVAARTAGRLSREGWLQAAVRLTWKPLFGAVACAVILGATIDHFIPTANSLPQAARQLLIQLR